MREMRPATSATSLMTRIQNGGRGDGKWKNRTPFILLTHIRLTLGPKCLRGITAVAAENTYGTLAASHLHVKSEAVRQRVGLGIEPVVVSLLTQPRASASV